MDFTHPEVRQMLADTFGRYLADHYGFDVRSRIADSIEGWSRAQWSTLAELGILGALFGEEAGGFGGHGFDIAVTFEQLGKALVVEPFLGTLMAGRALEIAGDSSNLINEAIAGAKVLAFAHYEASGRYDLDHVQTVATRLGDGWLLSGTKAVVPHLEAADTIVATARVAAEPGTPGELALFAINRTAAGVEVTGYPMIDGGRGGELRLDGSPAMLLGDVGQGLAIAESAVAAGNVGLCWEAVGIMDSLKDATLDYLRVRRQFGTAIGKFQVIQHRMAELALEIEQARSAAINAAAALDWAWSVRERAISAAKYTIGRVGTLVAEEAIQLHGGIGMTWELPLSHYTKRLTMIGHQLGDEDYHLERFITFSTSTAG